MYRLSRAALILLVAVFMMSVQDSKQEIPPAVWAQMKNITGPKDFIQKFLRKKQPGYRDPMAIIPGKAEEIPGESMIYTHEGSLIPGASDEVASMLSIQEDKCEIKLVSIPVPRSSDPNVIYWPSCVKLDQCSGCCNNEILECVPTMVQGVEMQVLRARYPYSGADYFEFEGIHPVVFNRHVSCECRCRVQPDDCDMSIHQYEPHTCMCRCFNELDAKSCIHPKAWSNKQCKCVCPSTGRECYDDERYDEVTCSCIRSGSIGAEPILDTPTPCDDPSFSCRHGFTKQLINGVCQCALASRGIMEGSLLNSYSRATARPIVPLPPIDREPGDFYRVPGHPQLVLQNAQETASEPSSRKARPSHRPSRRPSRRPIRRPQDV